MKYKSQLTVLRGLLTDLAECFDPTNTYFIASQDAVDVAINDECADILSRIDDALADFDDDDELDV